MFSYFTQKIGFDIPYKLSLTFTLHHLIRQVCICSFFLVPSDFSSHGVNRCFYLCLHFILPSHFTLLRQDKSLYLFLPFLLPSNFTCSPWNTLWRNKRCEHFFLPVFTNFYYPQTSKLVRNIFVSYLFTSQGVNTSFYMFVHFLLSTHTLNTWLRQVCCDISLSHTFYVALKLHLTRCEYIFLSVLTLSATQTRHHLLRQFS